MRNKTNKELEAQIRLLKRANTEFKNVIKGYQIGYLEAVEFIGGMDQLTLGQIMNYCKGKKIELEGELK